MTKKQKKMLVRILITAVMLIALKFIPITGIPQLLAYVAAYLVIGYDILRKAGKGILNGRAFDENFLMTLATLGAFFLAIWTKSGDYVEGIAVMLFYQIGELFQSYAVGRSRKNISALMDIRPDYANIEQDGQLTQVDPDVVAVGSIIVVQPGEKVPLDGVVVEGTSSLNTSALTGESLPRDVKAGDDRSVRRAEDPHDKGIRRVHRFEDPRSRRERKLPQVALRNVYFPLCQGLYACRVHCGAGAGCAGPAGPDACGG